ncbi:ion channel [Domibacillus sp. DTU_2020_1001157_1_SI_ALB_TIR_016]|uniref:potassium channel protein n=1 Tax=Domibacillus sp. DTU_2020_1001157_1_SI_ALB_TIR_016 TaxID=3077789 RepID=UPI0028EA3355|nr:ion channel [Domibacillus sp. DTU_2020_1001157_1_SI_ALB_TIR_016]WNS80459.1 ion channel [Domibacillus sp. DTU_2020_1001157_1_SI_ALB_TIR_016]
MIFFRRLFFKAMHMSSWTLFLTTMSLVLFSSFFMYYIEPETFTSPFDGLWWTMTTVATVGYGDLSPVSVSGKIFAMLLYVFGIGLMTVLIGKAIDTLSARKRLKEEGRLTITREQHIILINWTNRARITLLELLDTFPDICIVIMDETEAKTPFLHERVDFVKGAPASEQTLRQANFLKAKSIMIFSPDHAPNASTADGLTLLIASSIEAAAQRQEQNVYTICEVADSANLSAFSHANVEEFITPNDTAAHLAARSILFNGSSEIIRQLTCSDGYDLYRIENTFGWQTYREAKQALDEKGILLVASRHDLSIMEKLDEYIPQHAPLFIICNEQAYHRL